MKAVLMAILAAMPLNSGEATAARVPVLLELFTSEGCSSCPPADQLLQAFDREQPEGGAELIVISEHVDYWNHLGWADPYSSPAFTQRQQAYAARLNGGDPYTPELVVDGQIGLVGSDRPKANEAIQQALRQQKLPVSIVPSVTAGGAVIHVDAGSKDDPRRADIYVVVASDRTQTKVERGENAGHSLTHVAVAYTFEKVATWRSDAAFTKEVKLHVKPGARPGETRVITFVQDQKSGRVLGVAATRM